MHRTVREAIARADASEVADLVFEFQERAGAWMTSVEPNRPDAPSMFVITEPDNEPNLTVGRSWLVVRGGDDSVDWLRTLTEGVIAGRAEEATGAQIRIHSRIGLLGGGHVLPDTLSAAQESP